MKKREAEQLMAILGHENQQKNEKFMTTNCKRDTYMVLVRNQIALEPIKDELEKARKIAREKYATDELKELESKMQEGGVSDQERNEYYNLVTEFGNNMTDALTPTLEAEADVKVEKLSPSQFEQVKEANDAWMDLKTISVLYKYLVDDKPEA